MPRINSLTLYVFDTPDGVMRVVCDTADDARAWLRVLYRNKGYTPAQLQDVGAIFTEHTVHTVLIHGECLFNQPPHKL